MADQMPAQWEVRRLIDLLKCFLNLVFTEVTLAGIGGGANGIGSESFGNRDEADAGRVASSPTGRARDALAHVGQSVLDLSHASVIS